MLHFSLAAKKAMAKDEVLRAAVERHIETGQPLSAKQALALVGWPTYRDWLKDKCPEFDWDWDYLVRICDELDRVTVGEIDRLMVFMPPRHGKSTCITERYNVYMHDMVKGYRTVTAAYNRKLACRFSRTSKDLAKKIGIHRGKDLEEEWDVRGGGGHHAVGIGTGITGFGADLFVIDDPIKDQLEANSVTYRERAKDWFDKVAATRLEPGGRMVIILTRWHEDDLAGWLLRERSAEWGANIIKFPAIALEDDALGRKRGEALCPQRYDIKSLERVKRNTSESTWWSLYQQEPRPAGGAVYLREWWSEQRGTRYDSQDVSLANQCIGRYLSWDTAFKDNPEADYTACAVYEMLPDYRVVLREVFTAHLKYPELVDTIETYSARWNYDHKLRGIIVEDKASGISALQDLEDSAPEWLRELLIGYKVDAGKVERAQEAATRCRNGSVLFPHPHELLRWLADFETEIFSFPSSRRKDRTDAVSQGILYLRHYLIAGEEGRIKHGAA